MKTTCHDIQLALIAGEGLADEARQHIETCAECRQFAELHDHALAMPDTAEPPAALDQAILAFASRHTELEEQLKPAPPPARLVYFKLFSYAVAAALVVCLGVMAWRISQAAKPDHGQPSTPMIAHDTPGVDPVTPTPESPVETPDSNQQVAGQDSDLLDWNYTGLDTSLMKIESELALLDSSATTTGLSESTL